MKREEVLSKSRLESRDEGMENAVSKGRGLGVCAMSVVFAVLVIYNFVKGLDNYGIFAVFWTYIGFESLGKYRFTKGKSELVTTVAGILAGVLFFVNHIIRTL